ncbi:MAG TPA: hypothetical protein PLA71_00700 [Saccharofermentans sp.]|nr:hypothetical protein [Saccharofermentans sp.]
MKFLKFVEQIIAESFEISDDLLARGASTTIALELAKKFNVRSGYNTNPAPGEGGPTLEFASKEDAIKALKGIGFKQVKNSKGWMPAVDSMESAPRTVKRPNGKTVTAKIVVDLPNDGYPQVRVTHSNFR